MFAFSASSLLASRFGKFKLAMFSRVPFDPVLAWETVVSRFLFIKLTIRFRSREPIGEEVAFRMIMDYPSSEEDDD